MIATVGLTSFGTKRVISSGPIVVLNVILKEFSLYRIPEFCFPVELNPFGLGERDCQEHQDLTEGHISCIDTLSLEGAQIL